MDLSASEMLEIGLVSDWADRFPPGGKGVRTGPACVMTYAQEIRESTKESNMGDFLKLDMEAFVARMALVRAWSQEKSMAKWRELVSDKRVKRDTMGPAEFPLRLWIDPVLAVADKFRVANERSQSKAIREEGKIAKGKNQESMKAALTAELNKGHDDYSAGSAANLLGYQNPYSEALERGSLTGSSSVADVPDHLRDCFLRACGLQIPF